MTAIGIIGCGNISSIYMQAGKVFPNLQIVACADIDLARAQAQAERFGIPKACSVNELLSDPAVEIVINLTIPQAHAEVALAALEAGKSVYNEKPLAVSREDGQRILAVADMHGLRVGCAPDTFLGGGLQTCRALIDGGAIGKPVAATAFMMGHGPEAWHPNPEFFYQPGAGPMFDMGPYYLTALISMLGPIRRVTGSAQISFEERIATSKERNGARIPVTTPTHVAGVLDFAGGAVATVITSFDVWGHNTPLIEIYGSEGSLSVPDPNTFGGPVLLRRAGDKEWQEVALTHGYTENSRGLGVADMAEAIVQRRPHRASGSMAFHVLDTMHAFLDASREDRHILLASTCDQPAPLPSDWVPEA